MAPWDKPTVIKEMINPNHTITLISKKNKRCAMIVMPSASAGGDSKIRFLSRLFILKGIDFM